MRNRSKTKPNGYWDAAAGDGGYILSIGCAMDEAREDTLKTFIQTGKAYGKY